MDKYINIAIPHYFSGHNNTERMLSKVGFHLFALDELMFILYSSGFRLVNYIHVQLLALSLYIVTQYKLALLFIHKEVSKEEKQIVFYLCGS